MTDSIRKKTIELSEALKASREFLEFEEAKRTVNANEVNKALLTEYNTLQVKAQAALISGETDDTLIHRLQSLTELLQFNVDTSDYLLAKYRLDRMLGDVFKALAEAVDADLSILQD